MINQYIELCKANPLWKKPDTDLQKDYQYLLLGLSSEFGEVAEIYQKKIRDNRKVIIGDVLDELGDMAFYIYMLAHLGYGPISICQQILNNENPRASMTGTPEEILSSSYDRGWTFLYNMWQCMVSVGAYYGYTLQDIINANITKLNRRLANNTIHGEGSHR